MRGRSILMIMMERARKAKRHKKYLEIRAKK
jgi:hypothetical protein